MSKRNFIVVLALFCVFLVHYGTAVGPRSDSGYSSSGSCRSSSPPSHAEVQRRKQLAVAAMNRLSWIKSVVPDITDSRARSATFIGYIRLRLKTKGDVFDHSLVCSKTVYTNMPLAFYSIYFGIDESTRDHRRRDNRKKSDIDKMTRPCYNKKAQNMQIMEDIISHHLFDTGITNDEAIEFCKLRVASSGWSPSRNSGK